MRAWLLLRCTSRRTFSGPKRFAWDADAGAWLSTRDGVDLLYLLSEELTAHFPGFQLDVLEVRAEAASRAEPR